METYIPHLPFTAHPSFEEDRNAALNSLDLSAVDPSLRSLVNSINTHPQIFTLQCCHGHFVTEDGRELTNLGEGWAEESMLYRLAYLAVCIADTEAGHHSRTLLMDLPARVDPENVQFGSATWFSDQWPNSYVVQVMPDRYKGLDKARIGYAEAQKVEKIRDGFFAVLREIDLG
ncbi:MAG: hypothetical protein HKP52_05180 [Desulfofustis sp.]|nr:hypothetical protein [Desulfofustis sp.]